MNRTYANREENPVLDTISVWLYVLLVLIGLISIYSATSEVNQTFQFSFSSVAGRQLIWIGGAVIIILTIAFANVAIIDYFGLGGGDHFTCDSLVPWGTSVQSGMI